MSILQRLKEKGLVSEAQLKEVAGLEESQALVLLREKKIVRSEDILETRVELTGLAPLKISTDFKLSPDFLKLFGSKVIERYKILPLKRKGDEIEVGLVEPEKVEVERALDFIEISENVRFKKYVVSREDFDRATRRAADLELEVKEALERLGEERETEPSAKEGIRGEVVLQRLAQQAPVTQMVDVILRYGVDGGASDIHIEPIKDELRVRYRLDGKLKSSLLLPKEIIPAVVSRIKILARLRVDETRVPQGGRIHLLFDSRPIDFRVSTLPTIEGEKVVLRILDPTKGLVDLEQLGLQYKALKDAREFSQRPFGAMLISGPTGSGKSTTLYSLLNEVNKEAVNIVTLEDPVEYYLSGVNQSQVQPEIDYTFASGLREVLRQDPNIIMVGEVRDKETATLLVHAALTGHLVFSTIHTNDAVGIIPRLLDMGIDSFLIPASLRLAVAQRLLPKLCQDCKKPYDIPDHVRDELDREVALFSEDTLKEWKLHSVLEHRQLFKSSGCANCGKTGLKGRVGVFETLVVEPELEKAIMQEPNESTFRKIARMQGMITMRQDGILKALKGIVGIESVLASTVPSFPS